MLLGLIALLYHRQLSKPVDSGVPVQGLEPNLQHCAAASPCSLAITRTVTGVLEGVLEQGVCALSTAVPCLDSRLMSV